MDKKEREAIKVLAAEGKQISKIAEEDFPQYDYWDIYGVVYTGGGRSALGARRTISNRLKELPNATRRDQREMLVEEIDNLVWHLYESLKSNQRKLDDIRKRIR